MGLCSEFGDFVYSLHLPVLFIKHMSTNIFNIGKINTVNNNDITIHTSTANAAEIVRSFMAGKAEDIQAEDVTHEPQQEQIALFKYIFPSIVDDDERLRVHREVCNLVQNYPMTEICSHLMQMKKDEKVYLGVRPELMFAELQRLGMPGEDVTGYSYKNFMHHFNIK